MQPPAGVAEIALEFADHAGDRERDKAALSGRVIAVDRGDEGGPGGLGQVLAAGAAAGAVPVGQPVGQSQVGEHDLFSQGGIARDSKHLEPLLDPLDAGIVARKHRHNHVVVVWQHGGSQHRSRPQGRCVREGTVQYGSKRFEHTGSCPGEGPRKPRQDMASIDIAPRVCADHNDPVQALAGPRWLDVLADNPLVDGTPALVSSRSCRMRT
jgi:hypothetical protein